jgi:hypothetical protein
MVNCASDHKRIVSKLVPLNGRTLVWSERTDWFMLEKEFNVCVCPIPQLMIVKIISEATPSKSCARLVKKFFKYFRPILMVFMRHRF